jgi:uncharacterized damage-inducible protein DinB
MEITASLLDEALEAWRDAREGVIDEVRNLPEDALLTTAPAGGRSVADLVHHIAASGLVMAGELSRPDGDFQRQPYPDHLAEYAGGMDRPTAKAALLALLERTYEEGRARLAHAGETLLLQPIRQFNGVPARRVTWMHHGIGHEEYHRGQIALLARMLGHVPALTKRIHGEQDS